MRLIKALLTLAALVPLTAATDAPGGPRYTADGALIVPADYREWVFITSGLDMNYSNGPPMAGASMFDNVFVDRDAWQSFKATGRWPDHTVLVKEGHVASSKGSINKHGQFQTEQTMGVEFHVRDEARFRGGWAFFVSDGTAPATFVPYAAQCYDCHLKHGAVDSTFVQFYPTAKVIAKKARTFRGD